jgi:aspartyl-tRNA(Asn)/glutamyl-tRNA(Gln) amidotransferase subunit A
VALLSNNYAADLTHVHLTRCAHFSSRVLSNFKPCFNATAVQRLLDAGAVPIGKTVMDEFGMGSFTLNREGLSSLNMIRPFEFISNI